MKKPGPDTPQYIYLVGDYRQWLETLGYAASTAKNFPAHVRDMLRHFEEEQGTRDIRLAKAAHVRRYVRHLMHRRNERTGAGLGARSINQILSAARLFSRYLLEVGGHELDVSPKYLEPPSGEREVLTVGEAKELYAATFGDHPHNPLAMGQRDRAILAVYYGCGLRKAEGEALDLSDVDTKGGRLLVRKGKGNRERYVPIAAKHLDDLVAYMGEGRQWFAERHGQRYYYRKPRKKQVAEGEALFLSQKGRRMRDGLYTRVKVLLDRAGIHKQIGLHGLRHSIATHLLQAGMPLEEIAKFLGHKSLESTQIYTHIAQVLRAREQEESGYPL
jgi:site-specific recombinase XerD